MAYSNSSFLFAFPEEEVAGPLSDTEKVIEAAYSSPLAAPQQKDNETNRLAKEPLSRFLSSFLAKYKRR